MSLLMPKDIVGEVCALLDAHQGEWVSCFTLWQEFTDRYPARADGITRRCRGYGHSSKSPVWFIAKTLGTVQRCAGYEVRNISGREARSPV
jgi:hypothetical protein